MSNIAYERQYRELYDRLVAEGVWVENKRTGERCLTVIGHTFTYDVGGGDVPLMSTKQSFPLSATAELIGYLRGYTNASDFSFIGCKTWYKNANETPAWLANPARKGHNDMGKVYGAIAKNFGGINLIQKVFNNLNQGIDDRGETITFWKPDEFDNGCLRPCMRTHTFSILDGTLHLTSESRSVDVALGLNFNSIQCFVLLKLMAQLTGLKAGIATHNMINVHVYEKHFMTLAQQMLNKEYLLPECSIEINPSVTTLEDITEEDSHARDLVDIKYTGHSGKVDFEMTV